MRREIGKSSCTELTKWLCRRLCVRQVFRGRTLSSRSCVLHLNSKSHVRADVVPSRGHKLSLGLPPNSVEHRSG